jgi:hypothetical protein
MVKEFKKLSKQTKEFINIHGKDMVLDHLVKNVVGPQTLKKLVKDNDRKKFMFELKKMDVLNDTEKSFYRPTTDSIHIKRMENQNKRIPEDLKRSIGEEVTHAYVAWDQGKPKEENDIEEFYGFLGQVASTGKISTNIDEIYEKMIMNHLTLASCGNKEFLENIYNKIKEKKGCKNCPECKKCDVHKKTLETLKNSFINMLAQNKAINNCFDKNTDKTTDALEFYKNLINKENMCKHLGGYACAAKEIKERLKKGENVNKILKDLMKLKRNDVENLLDEKNFLMHLGFIHANDDRRAHILIEYLKHLNEHSTLKNLNEEDFVTPIDKCTNTVIDENVAKELINDKEYLNSIADHILNTSKKNQI